MNPEFNDLENQLRELRPARLPASVRQNILHEINRQRTSWMAAHRAGFQVALAGALSVALLMSSHWLNRVPHPSSRPDPIMLATSNTSLAFLEANFAVTSQIGINAVPVPRSASMLTNAQLQR